MTRVTGRIGALCLLAATGPELLAADLQKRPGRFRLGPLYLTPRFELRNAGVDTNVFHTATDPTPDNSIVTRFALGGVLPVGRRLRLFGDGYSDFNYFRRESGERSLDFGGEGRAELTAGRLTLFAGGGGLQGKQRFSIELTQRVLRQEKWVTGGVDVALGGRVSTRFIASSRVYGFGSLVIGGEDIKERLDRRSVSGAAELRYDVTPKSTALVSAETIEDRFFSQTGDASRRTLSYRYLGGFELGERALVRGKLLAGVRRLPGSLARGGLAYGGPTLSVGADAPFGRLGKLETLAERDVYYSAEGVRVQDVRLRSAYVYSRYRGELAFALPFDLVGRAFAEHQQARFLLPQDRTGSFRRVDNVRTFGGSLLRRIGEGVRIGGMIAWSQRVSNVPGLAYRGLVYGAQAEVVP